MTEPYRIAGVVIEDPVPMCGREREEWTSGGYVIKVVPCTTPSWLSRLFAGIKDGDRWRCNMCNAVYQWNYGRQEWYKHK